MTPADLKSTRNALGLSAEGFARAVGATDGAHVRKWERGEPIPRATAALLELVDIPEVRARLIARAAITASPPQAPERTRPRARAP